VWWDGKHYVSKVDHEGTFGNVGLASSFGEDTGEPFWVIYDKYNE
jgi:hypothetical protein